MKSIILKKRDYVQCRFHCLISNSWDIHNWCITESHLTHIIKTLKKLLKESKKCMCSGVYSSNSYTHRVWESDREGEKYVSLYWDIWILSIVPFKKYLSLFLFFISFALGLSCIVQDFSLQPTDSLVVASGLPSYGTQAYLLHGMWDLSSLTRDWTHIPCIAKWILNHWTTRKVPKPA